MIFNVLVILDSSLTWVSLLNDQFDEWSIKFENSTLNKKYV